MTGAHYVWKCQFCGSSAEGDQYRREQILLFADEHKCSYPLTSSRPAPVSVPRGEPPLRVTRIAGGRRVAS